jgi:hypothetical protein
VNIRPVSGLAPMALILGLVMLVPPGAAVAQDAADLAGPGCEIGLNELGVAGVDLQTDAISYQGMVAVDARARRIYTPNFSDDRVLVFSFDGRFIEAIGGPGQGPGEFRDIRDLHVDAEGTLWVIDVGYVHLFEANGELRRSIRFPGGALAVPDIFHPISDGRMLVRAVGPMTRGLLGDRTGPVHLLEDWTEVGRAFGDPGRYSRERCRTCGLPHIALAADGGALWLLARDEYRIERHSLPDGGTPQVVEVSSPWFEEGAAAPRVTSAGEPVPGASRYDVAVATDDRLWIAGMKPGPDWRPVEQPRGVWAPEDGIRIREQMAAQSIFVIEAVDARSGEVLARREFRGAQPYFGGNGRYLWSFFRSPLDLAHIRLWEIELACEGR